MLAQTLSSEKLLQPSEHSRVLKLHLNARCHVTAWHRKMMGKCFSALSICHTGMVTDVNGLLTIVMRTL